MTINKLNYEVYAIDYLDGNLTGELLEEMEYFMLMNPEIAKEFDMFNSMVFVSDTSIKYAGKSEMKKNVQFSILNYMNWIVPVCMSIAFMAVYPYIREYWITGNDLQPNSQPVKEVPYSQPQENTVQLDGTIPISSINILSSSTQKQSSNTIAFAQKSATKNYNVVTNNSQKETVYAFQTINPKKDIIAENIVDWDEEEKSTFDFFGKKALKFEDQIDFTNGDEIEMYPNEFQANYNLDKYDSKSLNGIVNPTPYLVLSFTPFGVGHDLAKTTNIEAQQLVRDLPLDEDSDIVLSNPLHIGVGAALHLSERVALETGYYITKRNINYYPFTLGESEKIKTEIRYINHSIPVNAVFALPFLNNSLNIRVGAAANWMGSRNYTLNETGSLADETAKTATIVKTPDVKLITTNDQLQFAPSMQLGFEYEKDINYGNIAFAVTYNRQMSNINDINVWDYNLSRNERVGEAQTFNMRYETVTASVKYTLPNKWYLNKK